MTSLVDYILSLFRSEDAARSFVAAPGQAMTNAGLINVSPAEFSSAAASALPFLDLGAGDPIGGLQQAVANQHGFALASDGGDLSSAIVAQDAGAVMSDAGATAGGEGLFAGEVGASAANVIATDVGAGLAAGLTSGLGAGLWSQSGLGWQTGASGFVPGVVFAAPTGGFGSEVGLGFGAGVQGAIAAQVGAGLGPMPGS